MELFTNGNIADPVKSEPMIVDARVSDWTIVNLCKNPSMNVEKHAFKGTYAQAVEAARNRFVQIAQEPAYDVKTVRVCDRHGLTTWFTIEVLLGGVRETNANTNGQYRKIEGAE